MNLFAAEVPMHTASPTIRSNVVTFPTRSFPALPVRRFGRPRQSSVYRLGVWLFNRTSTIKPRVTAALDAIEARYVNWRLRRSSKAVLHAFDDLIILNARSYPKQLDELVQEIAARKQHWQLTTAHILNHRRQGDAGPSVAPAN
jgi:hypothetical protein